MTRLAGILGGGKPADAMTRLHGMLSACRAGKSWSCRAEAAGPCAVGLCGQTTNDLACRGGVVAAIDGQIYNRDQLGEFATHAEAILALYERHGFLTTLRQLNGDFAIALYDLPRQTLWLGRDRFGVKPLYYHSHQSNVAFASQPRALLTLPEVGRTPNRQYVGLYAGSHYRYFDNDPDASPYAAIAQLPAAHALRVADGRLTKTRFWALEDAADFTEPEAVLAERYRELLLDAVAMRFKAAGRATFTLSGGMDSSSVLAAAVRQTGQRQHAFSTVYRDPTYDESNEIRSILGACVSQWHPVVIDNPDVFEQVPRIIAVHDEPIATATWLSHYLLCGEVATQGFTGVFGGLGGDELNAGEYEHFLYHFADLRSAGHEEALRGEVRRWVEHHDHPLYRKSLQVVEDGLTRLVDLSRPGICRPDRRRLERYEAALNRDYFDLKTFAPVLDHPFRSYLKNRTYQDMTRETIPCCLRAEDRQTTAFGLKRFVPFFDHRLVEFMFRVPGTLKYRHGVTKHLLREAMRGVLPEETRTRVKKTGWNAPAHVWFAGSRGDTLRDLVRSQSFRERGIYHVAEVERLIAEHQDIVATGRLTENHMMFLWQLVNLELWLQSLTTPRSAPEQFSPSRS